MVESVTAGGHAAVAGVAPGDVLLAVGARAQVRQLRLQPCTIRPQALTFSFTSCHTSWER